MNKRHHFCLHKTRGIVRNILWHEHNFLAQVDADVEYLWFSITQHSSSFPFNPSPNDFKKEH